MHTCTYCGKTHNVGFISTRLAGTDGVSLETEKWADVFENEGFRCFYFAGELDRTRRQSGVLSSQPRNVKIRSSSERGHMTKFS